MIHVRRLILLMLCALLVLPLAACAKEEDTTEESDREPYTVTRGDLTVDVSASGNLAFSTTEDLAFEMEGTVEDIFVEEGDSVTEGQVVATLDTSDWEEQLRSLKMSVLSAKKSLKQAEYTLDEMECDTTVSITGDVVTQDTDDEEIELQEMEVESAKLKLEDAEASLAEHLAQSPEVIAPFDGFVTSVTAEGGDEVYKGSVAITIADPDDFEALILVSEDDISDIYEGMEAEVSVDALSSLTLPATVSDIAATATVSSGVVNYYVTVKVMSLEDYAVYMQEQMAERQQQMAEQRQQMQEQLASGEMPDQLKQAVESGQMTQEEAEAMMAQMQSASGQMSQGAPQGVDAASVLEDINLREGMSVSITLIVAQATDVVYVPNGAITSIRGTTYVTVVKDDGTEEQREVTTGISDWQHTVITDGLEEGEIVMTTLNTSSSTGFGFPGGGMMMMGGPRG
jgi:RND family efflux transporter MFP subunit